MSTVIERVALPTGVRLPYAEHGDPAGPSVLLLHGLTDSWTSFGPVLELLPPSIRAVALTQRGHGDADRPAGGYAVRDLAADAAAVIDALGLRRPIVVGHSMGAAVAQCVAALRPDAIGGVLLAAGFGPGRTSETLAELDRELADLADPVPREFARDFQLSTTERPLAPALLESFVDESLKVPARVWRAACRGVVEFDVTREAAHIDAPTLLVWGDRDGFVTPADQRFLGDVFRAGRLEVYEGTGHAVHWEEPARFAADVAAFAGAAS